LIWDAIYEFELPVGAREDWRNSLFFYESSYGSAEIPRAVSDEI
jgi:hypothetical protein